MVSARGLDWPSSKIRRLHGSVRLYLPVAVRAGGWRTGVPPGEECAPATGRAEAAGRGEAVTVDVLSTALSQQSGCTYCVLALPGGHYCPHRDT